MFVFLVFTIIFLLSVSIYADGVGMTVKLPPPPPDRGKTYVIAYKPELGTYMLGSTDYDPGDIYISNDVVHDSTGGVLVDSNGKAIVFRSKYRLVNGSWVHSEGGTGWARWYDDVGSVAEERGNVIVFSTNNFYGTEGQLLFSAPSDSFLSDFLRNGIVFVGSKPTDISFFKILMYMYYPFRQVLPYFVVVIVTIIAFYKVWGWLRGQAQGV